MSGQVHCQIDSPARAGGARAFAKALLVSLCVHAALAGVFWRAVSVPRDPAQRDLRVELTPARRIATAVPQQAHAAPEQAAAPTSRSARRVAAPVRAEPAPVRAAERVEPDSTNAPPAARDPSREDDVSRPLADSRPAQSGVLPIDLRVLDWLAQYRAYPFAARRARIEGVVHLRVTLLPDGRLVDARIEQSSGHAVLDQAALDLLTRAAPLPNDFGSARSSEIELLLPIVYRMRAS